jgi:hypothetical protein
MYIKHKRSITAIVLIFIAMLFVSADKKMSIVHEEQERIELTFSSNNPIVEDFLELEEDKFEWVIEEISPYVSMRLGRGYEGSYYVKYDDEIERLFDKFNFPHELRDYFRQICELQNVSVMDAMALGQIESFSGNHPNYKNRTEERAYYNPIDGEKCWDDGFFQLTSYSKYRAEQEERFYNPELIASLGYIRDPDNFDANDDVSNIQVGVAFYGYLYRRFGDYEIASLAYNAGAGRVINGTVPAITYQYAKAVKNRWKSRSGDA